MAKLQSVSLIFLLLVLIGAVGGDFDTGKPFIDYSCHPDYSNVTDPMVDVFGRSYLMYDSVQICNRSLEKTCLKNCVLEHQNILDYSQYTLRSEEEIAGSVSRYFYYDGYFGATQQERNSSSANLIAKRIHANCAALDQKVKNKFDCEERAAFLDCVIDAMEKCP